MGCFIFFDYLIGLIILIRIHASWWAWLIYIVSVLVWFVIGVSHDGGTKGNPFPSRCPNCHQMKTLPVDEKNTEIYEPLWKMLELAEETKEARKSKKLLEKVAFVFEFGNLFDASSEKCLSTCGLSSLTFSGTNWIDECIF